MHPLTASLLAWYEDNRRELPWRQTKDPYKIWVSEVMLQQTRVAAVIEKYGRFIQAFPTVTELAKASEDDVLEMWQGLGYYARARRLLQAAKLISGGSFPSDYREFRSLPGVGEYTANAVFSICFAESRLAADGNILRVGARLKAVAGDITKGKTKKEIAALMQEFLPLRAPGDFNQALMDLGSAVCIPQKPRCNSCPLPVYCSAYEEGTAQLLPNRQTTSPPREVIVDVYWISCRTSGRILLRRRDHGRFLQGLWELPWIEDPEVNEGGRLPVENEKDLSQPREQFEFTYVFSHKRWEMTVKKYLVDHECKPIAGIDDEEYAWVGPDHIEDLGMATVFRSVLK